MVRMGKFKYIFIVLFNMLLSPIVAAASDTVEVNQHAGTADTNLPKTITLATTNWCPYACQQNKSAPGMVYEYIQYIGANHGYTIDIAFFPWARAIKSVESGLLHGLLTAIPSEAPSLKFTTTPTMNYEVCFFIRSEQEWRYKDLSSLADMRLGAITDYGYGEPIDGYISNQKNSDKVVMLTGNEGISRLVALLEKGRLDTFIDDKNVVVWNVKHQNRYRRNLIKDAGCLSSEPFYLALNPKFAWADEFLTLLNESFRNQQNIDYLQQVIKPKYVKY
jgi:polar amino acid transport system substrate-binding protein